MSPGIYCGFGVWESIGVRRPAARRDPGRFNESVEFLSSTGLGVGRPAGPGYQKSLQRFNESSDFLSSSGLRINRRAAASRPDEIAEV
jgi:hypothetical protein